ncbi:MAG: aminopeptidase [Candidatus Bathyarchaeia archaeon]|nr:aminopeptidase [Candidatus Bathyarchaeota archaeon]
MSLSPGEMADFAGRVVRESLRIGRRRDGSFESVRIGYNSTDPTCEDFALRVEEECWRVGAHTILIPYSSRRERIRFEVSPEDSLREVSPLARALARSVDATIYIGEQDQPGWASGLHERVRLSAPGRELIRRILDRRRVRWLYFGWPIPGAAEYYGLSPDEFRRIFFNAIRSSFSRELRELTSTYRRSLEGKRLIRIIHEDGSKLEFRMDGRPILVDDGVISDEDLTRGDVGLNIPCGEVFVAPLETTANGEIRFEKVHIPGFGSAEDLRMRFRRGRIIDFEAEEGAGNLKAFLEANTGDKDRIAEFGIGCNPGAEYTGGSIIVDEKIYGTIHIAIGSNTGSYHGRNRASSHLDMIKDMREGVVEADGLEIMRHGKPSAG